MKRGRHRLSYERGIRNAKDMGEERNPEEGGNLICKR